MSTPPKGSGLGLGPCTPPPLDVQVTLENYRWTSRLQIRVDVHPLTKIRADVHLRRILMPKYHFSMSMLQVSQDILISNITIHELPVCGAVRL